MKTKFSKTLLVLLSIFLLMVLTAPCSSNNTDKTGEEVVANEKTPEPSQSTREITDAQGNTLTVAKNIGKIAVDQWGTADIVVSVLGEEAMDKIVAVGITKSYNQIKGIYGKSYPQINNLPSIGGGRSSPIDAEKIISLQPDLYMIANYSENSDDLIGKLAKANIPTVILNISEEPSQSPQNAIKIVGELFGVQERADEIAGFIDSQYKLIESKNLEDKRNKPTVYMEKGSGTKDEYDVTWSDQSAWGKIVTKTGGKNIVDSSLGNSVKIDSEFLLSGNPDYIIIAGSVGIGTDLEEGQELIRSYTQRTGWQNLDAVKNNNIFLIGHGQERDQFCFFPHLVMAKTFYPEDFVDIEPLEILKEFYDKYMLLDFEDGHWYIKLE
ncbi:MAG: ABC transporter substrate-binding protein [Candidatus Atribacteria bacterium]|jgi:iron complex transport system substrate-binding protein|nr:ABC transporter substrate-binding protein [Candidatus Atribacteria bacterium]